MCGILAQINFKSPINPLVFNTMRDTMTHRGPDDANSVFFNDHSVGLGHRRLSIIDLTSAGQQPMCNEDESLWLTFNGEIYNYKSLRKELEAKGHQFASNTDSEVLLHGYEAWGTALVDRLKGMFAFCIWNLNDKSMFLARDRFGIKPLCYYQDENTFLAASELKAIVTSPSVPKVLNMKALSDYLVFRYVPSPHSIWKGIQKLPPACCMTIKADGSSRQWEYWKPEYGQKPITESQAIEQLDHLLEKSINEHLASDTPIGLLLSGGMDSSTIGHYLHKNGLRPNTFTVGFTDKDLSEHMDAKLMADQFETIHHELMLEDEFLTLVDKLTYFFDEPLGGTAFMPTYLVSKLASQHVKVVLGGHGGDEVFAGYSWFHQLYRDWYLRAPSKIKRLLKGNQHFFLDKAFQARSIANWHYKDLGKLIHPDLFSQMEPQQDHDLFLKYYNKSMSPIKNAQSIDLSLFNNEFGVSFLDKASMANSIEARVPLLDHELVEFMLGMDEKVYYKYRQNKHILKQIIAPHVPKEILNKQKSGFGFKIKKFIPIPQMETEIRGSHCYSSSGLFNANYIQTLFQEQDFRKMWCLYIFCKWFDFWDNEVGITLA